jgi:predicted nucleic acid-binding protein
MDIILDASAIMAIILNEPSRGKVINWTKNALLLAPDMISFETGNALAALYKRHLLSEKQILEAYCKFMAIPLKIIKTDIEKALKIACRYNIYAYDAYYLETAFRLKLPLITFDKRMKRTGIDMGIYIMEEDTNESI